MNATRLTSVGLVPLALLALGGCAAVSASDAPDSTDSGSEALDVAGQHYDCGSFDFSTWSRKCTDGAGRSATCRYTFGAGYTCSLDTPPSGEDPPTPDPPAPPSSHQHDKEGYTLTFLDEFDGVSEDDPTRGKTDLYFDRTKWTSGFLPVAFDQDNGGDGSRYLAGNGEQQIYLDKDYAGNAIPAAQRINPFFVHDSILEIESGYVPDSLQDSYWIGGYRVFYSGVLCTARKFSQKYGLFEIRMKAAPGLGAWPAFWLLPEVRSLDDNHWPPEIDVLEQFPQLRGNQTHWATQGDDGAGDWADMPGGSDVNGDFHVYGVEWTESTLTWFVDGQQIASARNNVDEPMYLLVNVAVGGT